MGATVEEGRVRGVENVRRGWALGRREARRGWAGDEALGVGCAGTDVDDVDEEEGDEDGGDGAGAALVAGGVASREHGDLV